MVIPVHYIDELLCCFAFSYCVKSKAVHKIFEESPEETTSGKSEKYAGIAKIQLEMTEVDEINDNRQVDPPDYQWMGFCKHFHITVTEELRLSLIVNLFKLHFPGFIRQK